MAQWIKSILSQHKDLNLDPDTMYKVMGYTYNLITGEGRVRQVSRSLKLTAQPAS